MTARTRLCRCCRCPFVPQPHNAYHQRYCTAPLCRRASKRASHRKWLRKNPGHHAGPENVNRVHAWRLTHPGYWQHLVRRQRLKVRIEIGSDTGNRARIRLVTEHMRSGALQDFSPAQRPAAAAFAVRCGAALRDLIGGLPLQWYLWRPTGGDQERWQRGWEPLACRI